MGLFFFPPLLEFSQLAVCSQEARFSPLHLILPFVSQRVPRSIIHNHSSICKRWLQICTIWGLLRTVAP